MKRLFLAGLLLTILAVDWAALHDIARAQEPALWQEWTFIALSLFPIAWLTWSLRTGTSTRR